jgi:tRNA U34 2-thiouridine synthase MnmA/TrmU
VKAEGRKAVVLLSGGLDSYTAAAVAKRDGYDLYALTLQYGQVHAREVPIGWASPRESMRTSSSRAAFIGIL